ncbi:type II toxin-antitoxin system RelE family toxin [Aquella oligotrophica]|uniref:type II toxin-antitoxin system RelE family toxin n=1 Tax=Aquella oligotrophica TaxID=2067065 RepID=UPI001C99BE86|nr:type II toxin-antitoxin system RelE/ParE family toxin [Aquella oligotrophica]
MSLAWKIDFSESALKQLKSLDKPITRRIIKWLEDRVLSGVNPRLWGKQLKGDALSEYWRYRVGDYRVLCIIKDNIVTVEVVSIGHRKEIYK